MHVHKRERPRHVNIIPQTSSDATSAVFKHMNTHHSPEATTKIHNSSKKSVAFDNSQK